MRVLVVDDDESVRELVAMTLSSEQFDVHTAPHGRAALDEISARPHPFDLIVLDIEMPVMDGRAFYRELRAQQFTTPVLVLSGYRSEAVRQELGAEAAIDKPFDPFLLAARVKDLVVGS
jgi:DNA-binding response OmpR family regulator